ncbi:MAG: hypothetical protein ACTHWW_05415 [Arthrobacter sp.]|uniref:hypothetical protein n=1 Tax=unclassified Arthrobacter TaxID=235627 RepID=UPI00264D253A|nr:hypothetical protein [Micrococcaceae bacterium]MDN5811798.1 hypothetical protein [Micrococcaceae bacterium]MDN5822769.1 hypothetical protein [Micrococcaceae bacterium]MDN5878036.1 hypothetical protein [Micrococcaceae bacterium]MDN5885955.1 hypothetical protein [Micrococcaceae bacterium]
MLKSRRNPALIVPAAAILLLGLSSCGSSVPDASEIFPKTTEAVKNAESVAINGDVVQDGKDLSIDISGTRDGSNSLAKATQDQGKVTILTVDETAYLKANKDFWNENAGEGAGEMLSSLAGDKWISVADPEEFNEFSVGSMLDSLLEEGPEDSDLEEYTDKSVEEVDGQEAYKYANGDKAFWVASEGEPYLLKVEGFSDEKDSDDGGAVTFSDWNDVDEHEAPSKDETMSIPGL